MSTSDRPPEHPPLTGGPPGHPPTPKPLVRPNEAPWLHAVLVGVPTYLVLVAVLLPTQPGSSPYGAGQLLASVALAVIIVSLLAKESTHLWRWWAYIGGVIGMTAVFAVLLPLYEAINDRL